ncbi:MAG: glycosyltransferase [Actinomycetota bacterium]
MKVSLIATVLNNADHLDAFLGSLAAQARAPDEIVIVDGGSTDGTVAILAAADGVTLIEDPGANISRGRNVAIAAAAHDVIAVTDADCVLEPTWLEELLRPLEDGADVAMGFYVPLTHGFFSECLAAVNLPLDASEVDPSRFMPSARSVAYRRDVIDAVGGYPEWLDIGEDMWVNHRWRERGFDLRFAPEAVVRWRLRPTLLATWRQYFRYARGDARGGLYPERHALRFGVYGGLALAFTSRRGWPKMLAATGAVLHGRRPVRRAWRTIPGRRDRATAVLVVPALMAWIDTAKLAGYAAGLAERLTGRAPAGRPSQP